MCGALYPGSYPVRFVGSPKVFGDYNYGDVTGRLGSGQAGADVGLFTLPGSAFPFAPPDMSCRDGGYSGPPGLSRPGCIDKKVPNIARQPFNGRTPQADPELTNGQGVPVMANLARSGIQYGRLNGYSVSAEFPNAATFAPPASTSRVLGGAFYNITGITAGPGDSGSPAYLKAVDQQGNTCWRLFAMMIGGRAPGTLGPTDAGKNTFQNVGLNAFQSLRGALSKQDGLQHVLSLPGSCDAVGPATAAGNADPLNFAWYAPATIDAMYAAQAKLENFLQSNCDSPTGTLCGAQAWANVIANVDLSSLALDPSSRLTEVGYVDDGEHPDLPYLHVTLTAPNFTGEPRRLKDAVVQLINGTSNGKQTVLQALASWGLPPQISVSVETA